MATTSRLESPDPQGDGSGFGQLIRRLRRRARLTQNNLADLATLSVRTIRDLESGRTRRPHRDSIRLLSDALGLVGDAREEFRALAERMDYEGVGDDEPGWLASPNQLPPDIAEFTGRRSQVSILHDLFALRKGATAIVVVSGRAGVGKTALAVHVAHGLCERFPDGRLFVGLRGAGPNARAPDEVLACLLRALGVPSASIPDGLEPRAELYRALLSRRQVLIVLDDAADERQARPLLPGCHTSRVLITSRRELTSLDSVWRLPLDVLAPVESIELLERRAGKRWRSEDMETVARIVQLCDNLPLAVRIVGARLAAHPHQRLAHLAERLGDERQRLDELSQGDLEVRASIGLTYARLEHTARRACRLLSLLDAPNFPAWVGGAMLHVAPVIGERAIERLVEVQLLEECSHDGVGQARYRFHDLVRLYGRERAMEEDSAADRAAALARTLDGWVDRAQRAAPGLREGHPDEVGWFDAELQSLLAAVDLACESGRAEAACQLVSAQATHFAFRGLFDEWQLTHELVLSANPECADLRIVADVRLSLGDLHTIRDRYGEALTCYREALSAYQRAGDTRREATAMHCIGFVLRLRGQLKEALTCFERALALASGLDRHHTWVLALLAVGTVQTDRGDIPGALNSLERALSKSRSIGFVVGEARVLRMLGLVRQSLGELEAAREDLDRALALTRQLNDIPDEMHVVQRLGDLSRRQGRLDEAEQHLRRCLEHYEGTGDAGNLAHTLRLMGELQLERDQLSEALDCMTRSVAIFERIDVPLGLARALDSLTEVHLRAGDDAAATAARLTAQEVRDRLAELNED